MKTLIEKIPEASRGYILNLIKGEPRLKILISKDRKTKHGDFRWNQDEYLISINRGLSPYRFLITLVHEIAHFEVAKSYQKRVKPHGIEWKVSFQRLMLPLLNPEVFHKDLLPVLAEHFKNPKASTDRDYKLSIALDRFENKRDMTYLYEIEDHCDFEFKGKTYTKIGQRRKRILAIRKEDQKQYSFSPAVAINL